MKYSDPIVLKKNSIVKAFASLEGLADSKITEAEFVKLPKNRSVKLKNPYSSQYPGGGIVALIDGLHAGPDFTTNGWQGYHGVDFEAVVDLGGIQKINTVYSEYLQTQRSWIYFPVKVDYYSSVDGKKFRLLGTVYPNAKPKQDGAIIEKFKLDNLKVNARYIKVVAKNLGQNPDWHLSPEGTTWIFVDEIFID